MGSSIDTSKLGQYQQQLAQLDAQAKKDKSVKGEDLQTLVDGVDSIDTTGLDDATKKKVKDLQNTIHDLQDVASNTTGKSTSASDGIWQDAVAMADSDFQGLGAQTDYISGITAGQNLGGANLYGPGTAYKGMTKDQALALGLPEQVAEVEARQQVNMIQDGQGNKYYITSDPKNPKAYQVWDADGKDMGGLTAPGVLGLNKSTNDPGAWLVLSDQGIAQSGTTSTDGMKKANASTRVYDLNGAPGAGQVLDKGTVGTPQSTLLVEGAVTNALASDGKLGDLLNKQ